MSKLDRRKLFAHSAHKTIGVSAGLAAFEACRSTPPVAGAQGPRRTLKVCLVSGSLQQQSDQSLGALQEYLEANYDVRCSRAFRKAEDDLPGLENLDHCDCMILFARRMTVSGRQLDRIKRYCRRGGAIVAIRSASHAFEDYLAMDKEVLGGDYRGHHGSGAPEVEIVEAGKSHPVLAGVKPFSSGRYLYKNPNLAEDVTVLLTGTVDGHTEPVAWTRIHRGGRVFYTSLGEPEDFRQPSFIRLLINALFWTTRRES